MCPLTATWAHSGMVLVIIVSPNQLTVDLAKTGTVKCLNTIAHTARYRILRPPIQDGRILIHFSDSCKQEQTQTSITFHAVFDFEKMVCCLMSIVLSIIKSARWQMNQRTLEFLSQRKEESPYTRNSPQEKLHYGYRKTYGLGKKRGRFTSN